MNRDLPNYSIIEIGQNTEKSPGDLKRLAVTQTPVKKTSANASGKNTQGTMIIIKAPKNEPSPAIIDRQRVYR